MAGQFLIAQLSDPHVVEPGRLLFGRVDTAAFLARAVQALLRSDPRPDVVVLTGDLVEGGKPAEYAHLRELLAPLPMPVFVIPGNHDDRESLRDAFAGDDGYLPSAGKLHYTVEDYPVRLVALDTLMAGDHRGQVDTAQLGWLDAALAAAPERPTVVMMHHPPFLTGIEHMDRYGLLEPAGLAEVIGRCPQVERILCGHLHRSIDRRFAGTIAGTAPGTAHQMQMNLNPGAPLRLIFEPPGYQLHLWRDGAGLVTHTVPLGEWGGPHSLRPAG
jgi:3',5'-cyclic-AMP phosphodiesterase